MADTPDTGVIDRGLTWLFGASWRTTLTGLAVAAVTAWPDIEAAYAKATGGDSHGSVSWSRVAMAVGIAALGRFARDRLVSSEREGVADLPPKK